MNSHFPGWDSGREPETQRAPDQKMFCDYRDGQMVLLHLEPHISECNHARETTVSPPERELKKNNNNARVS